MNSSECPVMLFDMASLKVEKTSEGYCLKTETGGILSMVSLEDFCEMSVADLVFTCYDKALDNTWIHESQMCIIALYNPVTGEISVGSVPSTKVFSANTFIKIPRSGLRSALVNDTLLINGIVASRCDTNSATFMRTVRKSLKTS